MPLIWTGLAPHPPILIAEVGGSRRAEAGVTLSAVTALARDLVAHRPDRLVLISPHTPRPRRGIASWSSAMIRGDFRNFSAPNTTIELPNDVGLVREVAEQYPLADLEGEPLDHGALVPLDFLRHAGWRGPTAVFGLPREESDTQLGNLLAELLGPFHSDAGDRNGLRTALLASGDMSHCLKPGAPAGYDPKGQRFDDLFIAAIRTGHYRAAEELDPELCDAACQDVLQSCRIAWMASDYARENHHFFAYEGPFGVGYAAMRFAGENL